MEGYIYCITDTTNGKQYIGQHHYDKEELDPTYHGSGIIISRIFEKRPETLKEEYLKTCYSQKELDEWEKYFIFTNNTLHPNGYNLTKGGEGGIPCDETRNKMSEIAKNITEEHRRKLSESAKGRVFTDDHRRKLSEAKLGKAMSEDVVKKIKEKTTNGKCSKKVLQYTKDGVFVCEWPSVNEIERVEGICHSNISCCCNGKTKTCRGYIWKYKEVS